MAPYIGNDIPEFEKPVLNMHITFGDGAGRRGDTYEIRYKPAEVTPVARAWTSRL